jgi:antitoxin ParD1/3/4
MATPTIGFRPTPEDQRILDAATAGGESTTDVIRRALRLLDREAWRHQAFADMERIAASGEDLSTEPDAW